MTYLILIIGFVLLIKGADFFVDGSSAVAKKLRVPTMIIGLTIVAMGTSAPECAVSIAASLKGNNDMAFSNVVGSNIFNLMVVVGVCALFTPVRVQISTMKHEFPFSILIALITILLGMDALFFHREFAIDSAYNVIGRVDGILLLLLFAGFLYWMVRSAFRARAMEMDEGGERMEDSGEEVKDLSPLKCLLYIVFGIAMVVLGGDFVVDSASEIAANFGMSDTLIGLTVVAFGTSLPELVTSIVAARKGDVDMALGNVIGSNIFNILFVLGIAAAISPVAISGEAIIDTLLLILMSGFSWMLAYTKKRIDRKEGILMILIYAVYVVYICMR